ncbi:MAG TPA: BON domain-containing protein [Polyangiales bacterium]|nr:BON domain-containing protein [Polyangiales bacterium]
MLSSNWEMEERGIALQIQHSIEAALAREAQPEANCVHVAVKDGRASLNGRVQSWQAWRLVHDTVQSTPGVQSVDDQLLIDSYLG